MDPVAPETMTLDDGTEVTLWKRGTCRFCKVKAMVFKDARDGWHAAHAAPMCKPFRRAIRNKRPCVIEDCSHN